MKKGGKRGRVCTTAILENPNTAHQPLPTKAAPKNRRLMSRIVEVGLEKFQGCQGCSRVCLMVRPLWLYISASPRAGPWSLPKPDRSGMVAMETGGGNPNEMETNELPVLAPAHGLLPTEVFPWSHLILVAVLGIVAALALAVLVRWRMRKRHTPEPDPAAAAAKALAAWLDSPEDKSLLAGVMQILRQYVTARFHLPPGEWMVRDLSHHLASSASLEKDSHMEFSQLMEECATRVYSAEGPGSARGTVARAQALIVRIESQVKGPGREEKPA